MTEETTTEASISFPEWYLSTQGPKLSQTIFNSVATIIPVLDLVLLQFHIVIPGLSETINAVIAAGVFGFFLVRAVLGHIKAKRTLQGRVRVLSARLAGQTAPGVSRR